MPNENSNSALYCGHAHEMPSPCPCDENCYCQIHGNCRLRKAQNLDPFPLPNTEKMSFFDALKLLESGKKVRRSTWFLKTWIEYRSGVIYRANEVNRKIELNPIDTWTTLEIMSKDWMEVI